MPTYLTAEQMLERSRVTAAAEAKAATAPESLTIDEVNVLPGDVTSRLMSEGKLTHLSLGGRRRPRTARWPYA